MTDELTLLKTNPYWGAPNESAEGIYEAGKEAQLEHDLAQLAKAQRTSPELREKEISIQVTLENLVWRVLNNERRDFEGCLDQYADWIGAFKRQILALIPDIEQAKKEERQRIIGYLKSNNPFVGYIDVVENIRMAKEQGWDRAWQALKEKDEDKTTES